MSRIILGTTPTIKYSFNTVDTAEIVTAILTIKRGGTILLRKDLDEATVEEGVLSWKLAQADTIRIGAADAKMMLNWVTRDGTRGASAERDIKITDNHIPEVI